jgi:hypothetical protein
MIDLVNEADCVVSQFISHVSFDFSFDGIKNKIDDSLAVL